jgi:hypothetical protein
MSDERERSLTRERVRRYRQRWAKELAIERSQASYRRESAPIGRRGTYRVVELSHPTGPWEGLPAAVFVCQGDWRSISRRSRVGRWLASLDTLPVECSAWIVRGVMSKSNATIVRDLRVIQIARWAGGWPVWLVYPEPPDLP